MKTDEKVRLTRKEKEKLVKKLYEEGYTYREIAKKLRISVRDISRILRGELRKDEIDEIKERLEKLEALVNELVDRLDRASYMIRHALAKEGIQIKCPICRKWSYLELKNVKEGNKTVKRFVCSNCGKVPF